MPWFARPSSARLLELQTVGRIRDADAEVPASRSVALFAPALACEAERCFGAGFQAPRFDVLATALALTVLPRIDTAERGFYLTATLLRGLAIFGEHPLLLHRVDAGNPTDRFVEVDGLHAVGRTDYVLRQFLAKLLQRSLLCLQPIRSEHRLRLSPSARSEGTRAPGLEPIERALEIRASNESDG